MLLTALAYATAGWLALWLAIPPSFASPLYPGAGIALAAALAAGPRVLPGVALGAWVVNAILAGRPDATLWTGWGVPAVMAVGAAAQAALGAGLIRRWLPGPLTLAEPRQVALFFLLGGPVACLLNASLSTATMAASGLLPVGASNFTWWTWWAGDTLGVLIAAPAALTLVGRPRVDWAGRRITVGLPLLVTTLLLAGASSQVARGDAQRQRSVFDRDAGAAAQVLQSRLQRALYALEAMHGVFVASSAVSADEMRLAAAPWLRQGPQIQGLGHAERVPRTQLPAWEARVRQTDQRALRVFDRPTADGTAPAAQDADVRASRDLEPVAGANATALGGNVLSVPAARAAALRSAATGRAAATEGFRLTQETADQTGVVVYQALGNGTAGDWRAMQFVTLRMDATVAAALA
ncbi:MAG: histidine kinase, partial [Burkholderiales bacterium PBB5]